MTERKSRQPLPNPGSYPASDIDLRLSAAAELLVRVAIRMAEMTSDENAEQLNIPFDEDVIDYLGGVLLKDEEA